MADNEKSGGNALIGGTIGLVLGVVVAVLLIASLPGLIVAGVGHAISNAFSYHYTYENGKASPETCAMVQTAANLPTGDIPSDANLFQGVKIGAEENPRLSASMLQGSKIVSNWGADPDGNGAFGDFRLSFPVVGTFDISVPMAKNPARATGYMVPIYQNALNRVDPELWNTDPERAATMTAFYAQKADVDYYTTPGPEAVHTDFQATLDKMRELGIPTDFGRDSDLYNRGPPVAQGPAEGDLNGKNVPEPLRSAFILDAKKYDTTPGILAGLYLTEQNGFGLMYALYDSRAQTGSFDSGVFFNIKPTDAIWHLDTFGMLGQWGKTNDKFRGPNQFGPVWESKYHTDGNGDGIEDVYNFYDATAGAARMAHDLGATSNATDDAIRQAARRYNGQVSWQVGGSAIRNPDPSAFANPRDLYAEQVVRIANAFKGGDTTNATLVSGCKASTVGQAVGVFANPGALDDQRNKVIAAAQSMYGVPYSWGGGNLDGPTVGIHDGGVADSYGDYKKKGFDCSALARYSLNKAGILLPRTAGEQWQATKDFQVTMDQAQPGDLVFFGTDPDPHHVGIYLGYGKMINAPQSGDVVKDSTVKKGSGLLGFTDPYAWWAKTHPQ